MRIGSRLGQVLALRRLCPKLLRMFLVTDADAAAIQAAYHQDGELSAVIEVRRRFSGITNDADARAWARSIAGWQPITPTPVQAKRRRRPF